MLKVCFVVILITCSSVINAEPTELQRQIINEPVSMIDLFFDRSERVLSSIYDRPGITLDRSHKKFPVDVINDAKYEVKGNISVALNWKDGMWIIRFSRIDYRGSLLVNILIPTIKTAKNICAAMLDHIESADLTPYLAQRGGVSSENYTAGNPENYMVYLSETLHQARLFFGNAKKNKRLTVSCERPANDIEYPISYNLEGNWIR